GGDASVCEATFIEGITNNELIELFRAARDSDYEEFKSETKELQQELSAAKTGGENWAAAFSGRLSKLRQRLTEIQTIDFFPSRVAKQAEASISELEE